MGKFTDLQQLGTKEIKYKQSKVTNSDVVFWALTDSSLSSKSFVDAQAGICSALTMAYLADMMRSCFGPILGPLITGAGGMTRFARNEGKPSAHNDTDKKTAALLAPLQLQAQKMWSIDKKAALAELAKANGLKNRKVDDTWAQLGPSFLQGLGAILPQRIGVFVTYNVSVAGKVGAHTVGLIRFGDGIHFFDPNVGGYLIHPDKFDAFMTKYIEILATAFAWQYAGSGFAVAYEVI